MFPPFFTEDAFEICRQTVKDLQEKKSFLKRVTKKSLERKNQGVMLGSLVCVDKDGTKIVLKAVSGISFQLVEKKKLKNHIVVPPIVSAKRIKRALSKNDRKIHSLTKRILIISDKLTYEIFPFIYLYTLLLLAKYTRLYNPSAEPSCLFNSLSNHSLDGNTI